MASPSKQQVTRSPLAVKEFVIVGAVTILVIGGVFAYANWGGEWLAAQDECLGELICLEAQGLARSEQPEVAVERFHEALECRFTHPEDRALCLRHYAALLLDRQGDERAVEALRESITLYDEDSEAYRLYCDALTYTRRFEELAVAAMQWFSHADTSAEKGAAKYQLGNALLKRGDVDTALQAYMDGRRHDPLSPNAFAAARIYDDLGKVEPAIELYKEYLEFGTGGRALRSELRVRKLEQRSNEEDWLELLAIVQPLLGFR